MDMENIIYTEENPEKLKQREIYNNKILKLIRKYLKENKQERFIQALTVLSIVTAIDKFEEDSEITYKRVKNRLEQIKEMKQKIGVNEINQQEIQCIH